MALGGVTRVLGSLLAGVSATFFMEYASSFLYGRQSEETRSREENLRTEMPTTALVRKTAGVVGQAVREERAESLGMAVHYLFGGFGGPAAVLLSERGLGPVKAGLAVGAAMEVGADQGMNTVLGLTAPTWRFPLVTQARAIAAHAVYGTALGLLLSAGRR